MKSGIPQSIIHHSRDSDKVKRSVCKYDVIDHRIQIHECSVQYDQHTLDVRNNGMWCNAIEYSSVKYNVIGYDRIQWNSNGNKHIWYQSESSFVNNAYVTDLVVLRTGSISNHKIVAWLVGFIQMPNYRWSRGAMLSQSNCYFVKVSTNRWRTSFSRLFSSFGYHRENCC